MSGIEIIADSGRRRWSAAEKLRIVEDGGRSGQHLGRRAPQWRCAGPAVSLAPAHARREAVSRCSKMTMSPATKSFASSSIACESSNACSAARRSNPRSCARSWTSHGRKNRSRLAERGRKVIRAICAHRLPHRSDASGIGRAFAGRQVELRPAVERIATAPASCSALSASSDSARFPERAAVSPVPPFGHCVARLVGFSAGRLLGFSDVPPSGFRVDPTSGHFAELRVGICLPGKPTVPDQRAPLWRSPPIAIRTAQNWFRGPRKAPNRRRLPATSVGLLRSKSGMAMTRVLNVPHS